MQQPLITTIIPTRNRSSLLKGAIQSVLNQTFQNFQILVCDNASDDDTEKLVKEMAQKESRIKYHRHSQNIGLFANFQYGMDQVTTPFFSFLSDDNRLFPWLYQTAIENFTQFPDAAFFIGATLVIKENKKNAPDLWTLKNEGYHSPLLQADLPEIIQIRGWDSFLFSRKIKEHFKSFEKGANIQFDVDFLLRASLLFPFATSNRPCATFYIHGNAASASIDIDLSYANFLKIIENLKAECSNLQQKKMLEEIMWNNLKNDYIYVVAKYFVDKNKELALRGIKILETKFKLTAADKIKIKLIKIGLRQKFFSKLIVYLIKLRNIVVINLISNTQKRKQRKYLREILTEIS